MIHVQSTLRNALAGLALAIASVSGAQALTIPTTVDVTVGTDVFTIGTLTGTFADNQTQLESQPWWGSRETADTFLLAVGETLGLPNLGFTFGPAFAWNAPVPSIIQTRGFDDVLGPNTSRNFNVGDEVTYAVVESVAPIPLPPAAFLLLGGLGALGLVKRRRA